MNKNLNVSSDEKISKILNAIMEVAAGNYGTRLIPSEKNDEIDAIMVGLNMLAEEIEASGDSLERLLKERTNKLTESEIKYSTLAESASEHIFIINQNFVLDYVNESAAKFFSASPNYLVGKNINELFPPTQLEMMKANVSKAFSAGISHYDEREFVFNERSIWLQTSLAPIYSSDKRNVVSVLGISRDITERKQIEKDLYESEERFRQLFENSPIGIYRTTPDGRILASNPAITRMLGYSSFEDYADRNLEKEPDTSFSRSAFKEQLERDGYITGLEAIWHKSDNTLIYVRENAQVVRDQTGKILYYDGTVEDVTERKRTEAEVQRRANEIASLYETTRDLAILPEDLTSLLLNIVKRAVALLIRTDGGIYLYDKEHGDLVVAVATNPLKPVGTRVQLGEGMAGRVALTHQPMIVDDYRTWPHHLPIYEGAPITAVIEVPMLYRSELLGVLVVEEFRETTRKFTQDDLRLLTIFAGQAAGAVHTAQLFYNVQQINAELEKNINELKATKKEIQKINLHLEELNANKDKFFSIIAHDLRSPFNGLINASEILLNEFETLSKEEIKEFLQPINSSVKNIYKLLENLLNWSLNQMGKMEYEPSNIDLSKVVNKTFEDVREEALKKNISISNHVKDNTFVHADINILHTIIRNLIINSIKFTNPGGKISVSSVTKDPFVEVSVQDNGIGISPEIIGKLFHIDKSHPTKGTAGEKGTGLGLPLCRDFVEMHGGKIWVESELEKGTKLTFTLPEA
ncbi:MAG: PAS domain S-box protein [Ignavibacteriales bacterium]|nr:PAS domain S-box protein [Ignavibacteriales bacterium]